MECDQLRLFVRNQLSEPQRSRPSGQSWLRSLLAAGLSKQARRQGHRLSVQEFTAAEQACEVILGYLISDSPSSRAAAYSN